MVKFSKIISDSQSVIYKLLVDNPIECKNVKIHGRNSIEEQKDIGYPFITIGYPIHKIIESKRRLDYNCNTYKLNFKIRVMSTKNADNITDVETIINLLIGITGQTAFHTAGYGKPIIEAFEGKVRLAKGGQGASIERFVYDAIIMFSLEWSGDVTS